MSYRDGCGRPLRASGSQRVHVIGHEGDFETVNLRPEGVAVIRNLAPGYPYTSTVPLWQLTLVEQDGTP